MWASVSIWPGLSCGPPTDDMLCRGRAGAVTAPPVAGRPASRTSSVTPPAWLTGFTAARSFMTAGSRRGWGQRCRQSPAPSPAGCAVPSCVQGGPIAATVPRASCPHGTRDRGRGTRAGGWPGEGGVDQVPAAAPFQTQGQLPSSAVPAACPLLGPRPSPRRSCLIRGQLAGQIANLCASYSWRPAGVARSACSLARPVSDASVSCCHVSLRPSSGVTAQRAP